uniref:HNH endonuclease n=1 Tax=Mesocestoides corti TaxID=53468 RepID=A0A5K3ETL8_MESCO
PRIFCLHQEHTKGYTDTEKSRHFWRRERIKALNIELFLNHDLPILLFESGS